MKKIWLSAMPRVLWILILVIGCLTQMNAQVRVAGILAPISGGSFPVVDDGGIYGGFRVAASTTERDALGLNFKKIGMVVSTVADGKLWRLTGLPNTWVEVTTGGGSSVLTFPLTISGQTVTGPGSGGSWTFGANGTFATLEVNNIWSGYQRFSKGVVLGLTTTARDLLTGMDQWTTILNTTTGFIEYWNGSAWVNEGYLKLSGGRMTGEISFGTLGAGYSLGVSSNNPRFSYPSGYSRTLGGSLTGNRLVNFQDRDGLVAYLAGPQTWTGDQLFDNLEVTGVSVPGTVYTTVTIPVSGTKIGQLIFDSDLGVFKVWNGSTWSIVGQGFGSFLPVDGTSEMIGLLKLGSTDGAVSSGQVGLRSVSGALVMKIGSYSRSLGGTMTANRTQNFQDRTGTLALLEGPQSFTGTQTFEKITATEETKPWGTKTTSQINSLSGMVVGTVVFDSDMTVLKMWNGVSWVPINTGTYLGGIVLTETTPGTATWNLPGTAGVAGEVWIEIREPGSVVTLNLPEIGLVNNSTTVTLGTVLNIMVDRTADVTVNTTGSDLFAFNGETGTGTSLLVENGYKVNIRLRAENGVWRGF